MKTKVDLETFEELAKGASVSDLEKLDNAYKLLSYVPNPGLDLAHADDKGIRAIFGGNRSGKTVWGMNEVANWAYNMHPYFDWIDDRWERPLHIRICCPSFNQGIKGVILPTMREWFPFDSYQYISDTRTVNIWETDEQGNRNLMADVELMCFSGYMPVLLPDGSWKNIKDLEIGDLVQTRFGPKKINNIYKYNDAPVYQIRLWGGHRLVCTGNHKHLIKDGDFVRTDWLESGDILQLTKIERQIDAPEEEWRIGWTAIMIGDGCLRARTPFFTSVNKKVLEHLPPLPPTCHIQQRPGNDKDYFISTCKNKGNPLKAVLIEDGLWNKKSEDKFVPSWVFKQPEEQIRKFLEYIWITDGTHTDRQSRYYTTSEELAYGIKHLIEILGYTASINKRIIYGGYSKKGGTPYFTVCTSWSQCRWEHGRIRKIEEYGTDDIYCVEIDDVHELIVDNIVTSNSYDQDLDKFGGQSKHLIWCDEEPPYAIWQENMMRLLDTGGYMLLTMTPVHGMSWVYEDIYLSNKDSIGVYHAATLDNPHLSMRSIDKIRDMINDEDEEAVRLYGEFIPTSHFIYPSFAMPVHIVDPLSVWKDGKLPDDWMVVLGMDPHDRTPHGVIFCAINRDNEVYVFDEISHHCLLSDLAQLIKKKLHGRIPAYSMIDSSANTESSIAGRSMIQELAKPGNDIHALVTKKGRNSVLEGISTVRDYLAWRKDENGKFIKKPRLYIFSNCKELIREFRLYVWEDWKGTNRQRKDPKESPLKKDDHLLDALRYVLMTQPYYRPPTITRALYEGLEHQHRPSRSEIMPRSNITGC